MYSLSRRLLYGLFHNLIHALLPVSTPVVSRRFLARFSSSLTKLLFYALLAGLAWVSVVSLPGFAAVGTASPVAPIGSPVVSRLDQGRTLYAAGRYSEAAALWQQAAAEFAAQNDWANQALSLSYLCLAQQSLNQWSAAETAIQQSLAILQSPDHRPEAILLAQALNTQASLLLQQGQTQTALSVWQQAETYYQQAGDRLGRLGSQINQVQALQILGFYRRSRDLLQQIDQELAALPDSSLKISGLRTLGLTLRAVGDLAASREALQASLSLAERLQAKTEFSPTWLALGKTVADQGDLKTAITYFQQAERQSTQASDQLQARLSQLHLYVEARQTLTDQQWYPVDALAVEIYRQLTDLPASRTTIYGAVNLVSSLLQLEAAKQPLTEIQLAQLLAQAVQAAQALADPLAEAQALAQWGRLYSRTEQWSEASRVIQQSLALARQIQANDVAAQAAWQLGKILRQQGRRAEAIGAYDEAVNALQSLRRDLVAVNTDIQFSFRKSVEPVYRELVSLLLDQPDQAALIRARELIEALQLAELDNFFREACLDATPQPIDQIDQTAAVIYPMILPDRLATVVSLPGQPLRYYATPIAQAQVESYLRDLLAAFHPVIGRQTQLQLSQQLYDWLIRPAEAQLSLVKTLVFVPDGLLRNIPMAALHDGQQYLIEKYAVSLSPGLRLMANQSHHKRLKAVVGGISAARNGFAPLPAVETEVESISQLISATALLNQDFTAAALAQKLRTSSANIVHLATHGQFSSRLEDTFLLTWEGRININEMADLLQKRTADPAQPLDLLVLSACDTAAGDDRAVLGLAGLAVRSGAQATLATLWPVKDQAASLLMTAFYQALQQPHITKAEALRQSQRRLIEQTDYSDPFFWAAFVLVGDWL